MNPQQQLTNLDRDGIAYTLARFDVQVGQNLMKFVEYEVLNHDSDWLELSEVCMQIKTGPRNGWHFSRDDLEKHGPRARLWFRWENLGTFEIRQEGGPT
jgi:hypothetical protein